MKFQQNKALAATLKFTRTQHGYTTPLVGHQAAAIAIVKVPNEYPRDGGYNWQIRPVDSDGSPVWCGEQSAAPNLDLAKVRAAAMKSRLESAAL